MRRDDEGTVIEFERGDVVWGVDPFKQNSSAGETGSGDGAVPRPWLVISTESVPFHPEQYLCVTLTTRTWHDDAIPVPAANWEDGGAPEETSVMPWAVAAIKHDFLDTSGELVSRLEDHSDGEPTTGYQGRLKPEVVDDVTRQLIGYLEESIAD